MAVNNTGGSFLDKLLGGIKQIARNFITLPQRTTLNFINFPAVVDNPSMGTTDVYGTSGSTGGGITIIENNGAAMPAEPALNFVGFVLGDDPGNSRTNVALPSPGTTAVANGGTGRTSLTSHAVLLGEGGSPVGFAVPTSAGFVLTDNGPGADPTFQASTAHGGLPSGTGIVEVTSGVGGVVMLPTGTSADTSLTFDAVAFPSSPNLGWSPKAPVFNIRTYGAVGGNAALDTAGLARAIALASSIPGGTVYIPAQATAFQINAEQTITQSIRVVGDRGSTLQAVASIRSILRLQSDIWVSEITFDGNNQALYGILFNGAAHSTVDACDFLNCVKDAWRVSSKTTSAIFTAGSHTGGGPSGMTLSQPDALLVNVSTGTISIKITAGGALGTATYRPSYDGGVSYDPVDQTLFANTAIAISANPVIATDSGVRIAAPAGTYVLNAVYNFTGTSSFSVANEGIAIRSDCFSDGCGLIYVTTAIAGDYVGLNTVAEPAGGATWTAGSQFVTFPSGGLLAKGARDGDSVRLVGAKFPLSNRATPQQFTDTTSIACVLSDTLMAIDPLTLPTANGAGADYAIGVGWGAGFVDPTTGRENDQVMLSGGHYQRCANGFRDASLNPGVVDNVWVDNYGLVGIYIGTEFSD